MCQVFSLDFFFHIPWESIVGEKVLCTYKRLDWLSSKYWTFWMPLYPKNLADVLLLGSDLLAYNPASEEHSLKNSRWHCYRLLLFHCDIHDITVKCQNGGEQEVGVKRAGLGLSFTGKEQEKIIPQPNIYWEENKQHQVDNQRLSYHPFGPIHVQTRQDLTRAVPSLTP